MYNIAHSGRRVKRTEDNLFKTGLKSFIKTIQLNDSWIAG